MTWWELRQWIESRLQVWEVLLILGVAVAVRFAVLMRRGRNG